MEISKKKELKLYMALFLAVVGDLVGHKRILNLLVDDIFIMIIDQWLSVAHFDANQK